MTHRSHDQDSIVDSNVDSVEKTWVDLSPACDTIGTSERETNVIIIESADRAKDTSHRINISRRFSKGKYIAPGRRMRWFGHEEERKGTRRIHGRSVKAKGKGKGKSKGRGTGRSKGKGKGK